MEKFGSYKLKLQKEVAGNHMSGVNQIRIYRNHPQGANLIFLVGACFTYKTHYVLRMSVICFKNDKTSFWEHIFSKLVILAKHVIWSKAKIVNILA